MNTLKSAYNILLGTLVVAAMTACSDPASPREEMSASLTILREERITNPGEGILPFTPTLRVGKGEVEILGQVRTPTPCYELSTSLLNTSNVITLTVTAKSTLTAGGVCTQVLVVRDYGVAIRHIPAGEYTVRVVHITDENPMPGIVLEQRVAVP